jgi:glycerol-3-phosphate dehydrogenase (NAD(P)+)
VSINEALDCEYIIITIPSQSIKKWLDDNFKYKNQKILVAAKGIEANSGKFLQEIYKDFIPLSHIGFISGPSFASEVIKGLPTAIVINSKNKSIYDEFSIFFPSFMKIYYSNDVIGAEIAGAYKNVLAIASGICEGLNLGQNARASLISRGLVEMSRFGKYYGASSDTFIGLSGAGDLFLTASSKLSRNFRVGLELAKNKKIEQILDQLGEVAEGVTTSEAIYKLSSKNKIYTPIANEIKFILNGKNIKNSINDLLSTNKKD